MKMKLLLFQKCKTLPDWNFVLWASVLEWRQKIMQQKRNEKEKVSDILFTVATKWIMF